VPVRRATIHLLFCSLFIAGCAGTPTHPVGPDHPAHPDAAAAPRRPESITLTLGPAVGSASADDTGAPAVPAGGMTYACPMHPKVTSAMPGKCPECGMALKPVPGRPVAAPQVHDHGGHQ
jgi:hypothetical protein